jgi:hypothetical protein
MPNLPWRYRLTRSFIPPRPSWQTEPPEISTQRNRTRVLKGHLFISLTRALHEIQILPTISFFLENLPCVANRDSASLSGFVQQRHIQQMNQSDPRISAPFSSTRGRPKSRHPSSQSTPPAPSSIQNNPFIWPNRPHTASPNDWPIGQMKTDPNTP